jgi:hypothetical protein
MNNLYKIIYYYSIKFIFVLIFIFTDPKLKVAYPIINNELNIYYKKNEELFYSEEEQQEIEKNREKK